MLAGLGDVDAMGIATKTIGGLYGAATRELNSLSIQTAASLIVEEPQCSQLVARLLLGYTEKEVRATKLTEIDRGIAAIDRRNSTGS